MAERNISIDDLQAAYYKRVMREQEQDAAQYGSTLDQNARNMLYQQFARDGKVDISVILSIFEPSWDDHQQSFYRDEYERMEEDGAEPEALQKQIRKWANQTDVEYAYACECVGHKPEVEAKPKRARKRAANPSPQTEANL